MLAEVSVVDGMTWRQLIAEPLSSQVQPLKVQLDKGARTLRITPWAGWMHDLRILGGDWLPVGPGGQVLLEQMVHSPELFLPKSRHLNVNDGRVELADLPVRDFNEDVILLGGSPNYYHWLIDNLPRLLHIKPHIGRERLLVPENLLPFQRRTLELLGYGADRLIFVGNHECVRASRVLVPSLLAMSTFPHPDVVKMLRRWFLFKRHPDKPFRRVFVSRADAQSRRLVNEDALWPILSSHGFERVVLGQMSFDEQVRLFAEVDVLLAVHGAGMTNMVFMPPKSRVIEIACAQHPATFFTHLALVSARPYRAISAEAVTVGEGGNPLGGDWSLNPDVLEQTLAQLGRLE